MDINYINIYNNLVNLTRNKDLYKNFKKKDTFADRLTFLLIHLAFFLKVYKKNTKKEKLQEIHDYVFRQLELSIREIGYGDQSINKKMKDYINFFYSILDRIHYWDDLSKEKKESILLTFLDKNVDVVYLVDYFNKYIKDLLNNPLNFYLKGVIKP
jgi:cytochrome b pre-mRNA-processing protein 3